MEKHKFNFYGGWYVQTRSVMLMHKAGQFQSAIDYMVGVDNLLVLEFCRVYEFITL